MRLRRRRGAGGRGGGGGAIRRLPTLLLTPKGGRCQPLPKCSNTSAGSSGSRSDMTAPKRATSSSPPRPLHVEESVGRYRPAPPSGPKLHPFSQRLAFVNRNNRRGLGLGFIRLSVYQQQAFRVELRSSNVTHGAPSAHAHQQRGCLLQRTRTPPLLSITISASPAAAGGRTQLWCDAAARAAPRPGRR